MFNTVFIEEDLLDHPRTKHILSKVKSKKQKTINRYDEIWGVVKKPYLQKRNNLNLFIAKKKGTLIKETPDAYGTAEGKHYYFIHSYNCIYECEYCYLQGHFNTPDIVFFINHEDIINEMQAIADENKGPVWFHGGEFSDSLNLSHVTNEYSLYYEFFEKNSHCFYEIRTKSVNTKEILKHSPLKNIVLSFSLGSEYATKKFDHKCPSVKARIKAIMELSHRGYQIGLHFDPVIFHETFLEEYKKIFSEISKIPNNQLQYISLGVVRFTKSVYRDVELNYPNSTIHTQELIKSFDNKLRYNRPMRMWILSSLKSELIASGISEDLVYFCME